MKKILLTMVALLSMTTMMAQTSSTERKAPRRMTHEEMTSQMTIRLNLTDAQKTQVAALNKEYQDYLMPQPPQRPKGEKADSSKEGKKDGSQGQKPEMKRPDNSKNQAKRQEYEKKLKEILSDDQYENYQAMVPQGRDKASKGKKAQSKQKKEKN